MARGVGIHQDARSADARDCQSGSDGRVGGEDDLIPGSDSVRAQQELRGVGPVRDADAMFDVAEAGEGAFEGGDFLARGEVPAVEDAVEAGLDSGRKR